MKKILFLSGVPAEVRAIPQPIALGILKALHRYIKTGQGGVKPLAGEFAGLLRLRIGDYLVLLMKRRTPSQCIAFATARTPTSERITMERVRPLRR